MSDERRVVVLTLDFFSRIAGGEGLVGTARRAQRDPRRPQDAYIRRRQVRPARAATGRERRANPTARIIRRRRQVVGVVHSSAFSASHFAATRVASQSERFRGTHLRSLTQRPSLRVQPAATSRELRSDSGADWLTDNNIYLIGI